MNKVKHRISPKLKTRSNKKKYNLFKLERVDSENYGRVVQFVKICIEWLKENNAHTVEGIFRKAPNDKDTLEYQKLISKKGEVHFEKTIDPHLVATLLKRFLGSMQEPLVPYNLYSTMIAANDSDNEEERQTQIMMAVSLLPDYNYDVLAMLFKFLQQLSIHHEVTKMDANNLAICWAPNIFRPPGNDASSILWITDMGHLIELVVTMIVEVDTLFVKQSINGDKTRAFKKAMQTKYSRHSLNSLKTLDRLRAQQKTRTSTDDRKVTDFDDQLVSLTKKLRAGDSEAARVFIEKDMSNARTPFIQRTAHRRILLESIFQDLSDLPPLNSPSPSLLHNTRTSSPEKNTLPSQSPSTKLYPLMSTAPTVPSPSLTASDPPSIGTSAPSPSPSPSLGATTPSPSHPPSTQLTDPLPSSDRPSITPIDVPSIRSQHTTESNCIPYSSPSHSFQHLAPFPPSPEVSPSGSPRRLEITNSEDEDDYTKLLGKVVLDTIEDDAERTQIASLLRTLTQRNN